jgi:hypothetical protein
MALPDVSVSGYNPRLSLSKKSKLGPDSEIAFQGCLDAACDTVFDFGGSLRSLAVLRFQ